MQTSLAYIEIKNRFFKLRRNINLGLGNLPKLQLVKNSSNQAIFWTQIKSFIILVVLYYAETRKELARPISASLHPGNTASLEEMSQRWRAVGNTVSDLTGARFEPQTSRSRDELPC